MAPKSTRSSHAFTLRVTQARRKNDSDKTYSCVRATTAFRPSCSLPLVGHANKQKCKPAYITSAQSGNRHFHLVEPCKLALLSAQGQHLSICESLSYQMSLQMIFCQSIFGSVVRDTIRPIGWFAHRLVPVRCPEIYVKESFSRQEK